MRWIVLLSLATLAGCSDAPTTQCEKFIQGKLRSPSTYKRISMIKTKVPAQNPKQYTVVIEYDAANAYGTPVRDSYSCVFPLRNGEPDTSRYIDFDARDAAQEANMIAVDEAMNDS